MRLKGFLIPNLCNFHYKYFNDINDDANKPKIQ